MYFPGSEKPCVGYSLKCLNLMTAKIYGTYLTKDAKTVHETRNR